MSTEPLYVSASTAKSLWQEYRVYDDRLEFHTLVGVVNVPFDRIENVRVQASDVGRLFRAELNLRDFSPALKLDWANFLEHVVIDKRGGAFVQRILFTPTDPEAFAIAARAALNKFREDHPVTP